MADTTPPTTAARSTDKTCLPVPVSLAIDPSSVTRLLDLFRETLETTVAKALSQTQALPEAKPAPQPLEPIPSPKSTGLDLKAADRTKAADLRVALLMGKLPEDAGLLIAPKTLASLLDISIATLYRLQAEQAIPAPVEIGHLKKWRLTEILEWIEADCPPLRVWVHKRLESSKRKGK